MTAAVADPLEAAIIAGAARALRRRAAAQRTGAAAKTFPAGPKYPGVMVATGEARIAAGLASVLARLADEIDPPRPGAAPVPFRVVRLPSQALH